MEISEDLRQAMQDATRREDRGDCPSAAELAALACGELSPARRDECADHLAGCSDCAVEVRMAREAKDFLRQRQAGETVATEAEPGAPRLEPPGPPVSMTRRLVRAPASWLAAAAAVLLAVGLAWQGGFLAPDPGTQPPVLRAPGEDALRPAAGAVLEAPPRRLEWPPAAGAEGYRVEVLDASAEAVWQGRAPAGEARLELPREARAVLEAGDYLWTVEVEGAVARRRLGPYAFTIR